MSNESTALEFLHMVVAGDIDAAYAKLVSPALVHHNAYFPAGADALRKAMKDAHIAQPGKIFEVKQAVAGDDRVAVHSHLRFRPEDRGLAVVHIFRFEAGRIVEMRDLGQELPADSPNADGCSDKAKARKPGLCVATNLGCVLSFDRLQRTRPQRKTFSAPCRA